MAMHCGGAVMIREVNLDDKQRRLVGEGYITAQDNHFWRWLYAQMGEKKPYLESRLAEAKCWDEVCRIQGQLTLLRSLLGLCEEAGSWQEQ